MYESYFPKRKVLINSKNDLKPWLSKSLINACKTRISFIDFIRTKSQLSEDKHKCYKNKLTSILRYSQKKYYANLLENNRTNIKATWDVVNSVIKKRNNSNFPNVFSHNGKSIQDTIAIANGFNNFFVNVGPNLAKDIPQFENINVIDYKDGINENSMFLYLLMKMKF